MPKQIQMPYATASGLSTIYAIVRDSDACLVWDAVAGEFVAYVDAARANYAIALTEDAAGSRHYAADFPAGIGPGVYRITVYLRSGGAPSAADGVVGTEPRFEWDGDRVAALATLTSRLTSARASNLDDLAATVAAAVWSTLLPGVYTEGQAGFAVGTYVDSPVSSAGGGASAEAIATAVWNSTLPGVYGEGRAGYVVGSYLDVPVSAAGSGTAEAIASAVLGRPVLSIDTPSSRVVDAAGTMLDEVTVAQVLATVMVTLAGDRSGIGTRTVTGGLAGASGASISVLRSGQSTIESTVVVPTSG